MCMWATLSGVRRLIKTKEDVRLGGTQRAPGGNWREAVDEYDQSTLHTSIELSKNVLSREKRKGNFNSQWHLSLR